MVKSTNTIYQLIEENLKVANEPMTCNDLWDKDSRISEVVREGGMDKLSDYLGFMWRKGLLIRYPAPRTSKSLARYAYKWKPVEDKPPVALKDLPKPLVAKNNIEIIETKDGVVIELANISITIKNR